MPAKSESPGREGAAGARELSVNQEGCSVSANQLAGGYSQRLPDSPSVSSNQDNHTTESKVAQGDKPIKVTSGKVCGLVRDLRGMSAARKSVLFTIASRYPRPMASVPTIAAETGLSVRHVIRHTKALAATGIVGIDKGAGMGRGMGRRSNRYRVDVGLLSRLVNAEKSHGRQSNTTIYKVTPMSHCKSLQSDICDTLHSDTHVTLTVNGEQLKRHTVERSDSEAESSLTHCQTETVFSGRSAAALPQSQSRGTGSLSANEAGSVITKESCWQFGQQLGLSEGDLNDFWEQADRDPSDLQEILNDIQRTEDTYYDF